LAFSDDFPLSRGKNLHFFLRVSGESMWPFSAQIRMASPRTACGDAFPIEGVLVATYLLSVEALPHCRCGVANKNRIV